MGSTGMTIPLAPAGGHFRFTLSGAYSDADVDRLLSVLGSVGGPR